MGIIMLWIWHYYFEILFFIFAKLNLLIFFPSIMLPLSHTVQDHALIRSMSIYPTYLFQFLYHFTFYIYLSDLLEMYLIFGVRQGTYLSLFKHLANCFNTTYLRNWFCYLFVTPVSWCTPLGCKHGNIALFLDFFLLFQLFIYLILYQY